MSMVANTRLRGDAATTNALPAIGAVATPTAPDRPPEHDPAAPQRFAELLRQRRADAAPRQSPAPSPAPQEAPLAVPPHGDGADGQPSSAAAEVGGATQPPSRNVPTSRAPNAKGATGTAVVEKTTLSQEADAYKDADGVDRDSAEAPAHAASGDAGRIGATAEAAADPGACAIVIDGQRTPVSEADVGAIANDVGADATRGAIGRGAPSRARGEAAVDAGRALQPLETSRMQGSAAAAATDPTFRAALADGAHGAEVRATEQRSHGTLDSLGAAGAIGALARPGEPPATTTAPTVLTLATPIDAPDFAASLGVQVSVLANDGVQHAELHLNPAETGPVSIRIEVDGSAARVDFGADLAATRQAIERGLPELASALRDAGLTLTGGGVSQHAQGRSDDERDPTARTARRIDAVGRAAPPAATGRSTRRVALGGIDLYA